MLGCFFFLIPYVDEEDLSCCKQEKNREASGRKRQTEPTVFRKRDSSHLKENCSDTEEDCRMERKCENEESRK